MVPGLAARFFMKTGTALASGQALGPQLAMSLMGAALTIPRVGECSWLWGDGSHGAVSQ